MMLCGPMLLLDPVDLSIVANQVDDDATLRAADSVFVGVLPPTGDRRQHDRPVVRHVVDRDAVAVAGRWRSGGTC